MIGLYDADLYEQPNLRFPNLELMKLSTYFKRQKIVTKMLSEEEDIAPYDYVYLRKDYGEPKIKTRLKKTLYDGYAFTQNGLYSGLAQEAESCFPNIYLYGDTHFTGLEHDIDYYDFFRFSYDNKTAVFPKYLKGTQAIVYDRSIEWIEEVYNALINFEEKVLLTYKPKFYTMDRLKPLAKSEVFNGKTNLILDKQFEKTEFIEFLCWLKEESRAAVTIMSIPTNNNFKKVDDVNRYFGFIFNTMVKEMIEKKSSKLSIMNNPVYADNKTSKIFSPIVGWLNAPSIEDTLHDKLVAGKRRKTLTLEMYPDFAEGFKINIFKERNK